MDIYFRLLMGHLVGDYMLQSLIMASTKGQKNTFAGYAWCTLHCLIYSASVCLCLWQFSLSFFGLIFLSHFFVDKYSLANEWNKLIRGRSFEYAIKDTSNKREFTISFSCLVYAAVDNTMHLLLMWGALYLL